MSFKYQKLSEYFSKSTDSTIILTFYDIESIIGFALPDSAKKHKAAWYEAGHSMPKAWSDSSYKIESLDLANQTVVFKKQKNDSNIKTRFFDYIGPKDSLKNYSRSYKLIFFKALFEHLDEAGRAKTELVTESFKQFYLIRKTIGKITDKNVDETISNIEQSSNESVLSLIRRNPFKAINENQFVYESNTGYFYLPPQLVEELSKNDLEQLSEIIEEKIKLYYSKIDGEQEMDINLNKLFNDFLNGYNAAKQESFADHNMGNLVRNEIPSALYNACVNKSEYLIKGSVGQGNWATIPWICIFDKSITTTAQSGVYIVYLLSKDGKSLYLTLNQGCTDLKAQYGKRKAIELMHSVANNVLSTIDFSPFHKGKISLGNGLNDLGALYEEGCICYTKYERGSVPGNDILKSDLNNMLSIYKEYSNKNAGQNQRNAWLLTWNPDNWDWTDYLDVVENTNKQNLYSISWTCYNTHVKVGDKIFMTVLGKGDKNGIFAIGTAASEVYEAEHYNSERAAKGDTAKYVDILLERVLDYKNNDIIFQSYLNSRYPNQNWSPYASGIIIKEEYVDDLINDWKRITGGEKEMTVKETISHIKEYIASKGFTYPDGLIENFYLSLKSKPFVILAGTSGTGKTRLVKLFSEAIGATKENGRYKLVSVRPDWSDSSDLFGHVDLNGRFIPGAIIDFVKKAELDKTKPYILCLDEMNLARVEYYLSDILSIIETRDFKNGEIVSDSILDSNYFGADSTAAGKYGKLVLPENFYIVGTVNMDETTFPFSRKVLDRANTIEFSYVDIIPNFEASDTEINALNLNNDFLKTEYLLLNECEDTETVEDTCVELKKINEILEKAAAHIGYRVRDEISFYMVNNNNYDLLDGDDAFDNEIMQKILPRIQGSSASVKNMLCELFKICAADYEGYQTSDNVSEKMIAVIKKETCKYRKSAEKIAFMVRRYEEDGFTSYWL